MNHISISDEDARKIRLILLIFGKNVGLGIPAINNESELQTAVDFVTNPKKLKATILNLLAVLDPKDDEIKTTGPTQ